MLSLSILSVLGLGIAISSVAGENFQVSVGNGALKFDPEAIIAKVDDTVTYNFHPKNHSVTQSSFKDPCHPLAGGFFSEFVPTQDANAASRTTWTIKVSDLNPIWVYCSQTAGDHCQSGMVHAINAPSTGNTLDEFKKAAKTASNSTSPPDGLPVGGLRKTTVDVGSNKLTFSSNNITELPRTVIEFNFFPKNHSVVQSSFQDPCHPLAEGGFSSGFIPTATSPSGATFQITVNDTKPIWFYCAQNTATHCQAGMVGSINAPISGNTLDAFIAKAKDASDSTIPPNAPVGGTLTVNGTAIATLNGAVFDPTNININPPSVTTVPPPGSTIPPDVANMAGGNSPAKYGWAPSISDQATTLLQLINFIDNILLDVLVNGHNNITTGGWSHLYPPTIKNTMGSMSAQAIIHRQTSTESLQHYGKKVSEACTKYRYPIASVDDFAQVALTLILLEIALLLDVISIVVRSDDAWMIVPLASTLGSKARMAGLVNLMQNHIPAAAPREVMMPAEFVYSYVMSHYVVADSCKETPSFGTLASMSVTPSPMVGGRVNSVSVSYGAEITGSLSMAWLGPWGKVDYTTVVPDANDAGKGTADVPGDLSGHVWGVLTNSTGAAVGDLPGIAVAGPEIIWVTQPS